MTLETELMEARSLTRPTAVYVELLWTWRRAWVLVGMN